MNKHYLVEVLLFICIFFTNTIASGQQQAKYYDAAISTWQRARDRYQKDGCTEGVLCADRNITYLRCLRNALNAGQPNCTMTAPEANCDCNMSGAGRSSPVRSGQAGNGSTNNAGESFNVSTASGGAYDNAINNGQTQSGAIIAGTLAGAQQMTDPTAASAYVGVGLGIAGVAALSELGQSRRLGAEALQNLQLTNNIRNASANTQVGENIQMNLPEGSIKDAYGRFNIGKDFLLDIREKTGTSFWYEGKLANNPPEKYFIFTDNPELLGAQSLLVNGYPAVFYIAKGKSVIKKKDYAFKLLFGDSTYCAVISIELSNQNISAEDVKKVKDMLNSIACSRRPCLQPVFSDHFKLDVFLSNFQFSSKVGGTYYYHKFYPESEHYIYYALNYKVPVLYVRSAYGYANNEDVIKELLAMEIRANWLSNGYGNMDVTAINWTSFRATKINGYDAFEGEVRDSYEPYGASWRGNINKKSRVQPRVFYACAIMTSGKAFLILGYTAPKLGSLIAGGTSANVEEDLAEFKRIAHSFRYVP